LRLVDIAIARSTDPAAWDRRSWILVLGALGDAAGMPPLAAIAGSGKEPPEIRAAALRALASYRIAGAGAVEAGLWADEEIAALAPTRGATLAIPRNRPEVRQALRTANGIATSRRESPVLRRAALTVLQRMGNESVVGDLRLVLFEEWNVLGEEILQALTGIGGGPAADLLRDFALAPLGGTEVRLRAIVGLQALGGNRSLVALERIAQEVTDAELAVAAQRALVALEERTGGRSLPRNTGDLRPPGSSR
jgi:HEAT repeat protein